jgi:hypothetical protein
LKRRRSLLCRTCDRPVTTKRTHAFMVMLPTANTEHQHENAIASPICRSCSAKPQLEERALAVLKKVWPGCYEIPLEGGH